MRTSVLLGRCLLISILIATLAALHVLSAEVGLNPSAVMFVTNTERFLQHSAAPNGQNQPVVEVTPNADSTTTVEVVATSSTVEPGMNPGALLQCHDAGNCVLFPAAGLALIVLMMAGAAARALRRHHHITKHWTRAAASMASRRGPPLRRCRPRIALCVIRV